MATYDVATQLQKEAVLAMRASTWALLHHRSLQLAQPVALLLFTTRRAVTDSMDSASASLIFQPRRPSCLTM